MHSESGPACSELRQLVRDLVRRTGLRSRAVVHMLVTGTPTTAGVFDVYHASHAAGHHDEARQLLTLFDRAVREGPGGRLRPPAPDSQQP